MNEKLINLAQSMETVAACLRELAAGTAGEVEKSNHIDESKVVKEKAIADRPVFKIEDVRAALSKLSTDGHTEDVKDILAKHGAAKLSLVKPEDYASIMEMVKSFGGNK